MPPPRPRNRKLLFVVACIFLPFAALLVAELVARGFWPASSQEPTLAIDRPASLFSEVTVDGRRYYQVTHPEAYRSDELRFPIEKSKDTLRIFCLGESASAGWPHPPTETYWSYLAQALKRAYPDHKIEVLNVAAHAYASYRVRLIFDDVIRFAPDLLILWCGNNEFVEDRAYVTSAGLGRLVSWLARGSRLFALLDDSMRSWLAPESTIKKTAAESLPLLAWKHVEQVAGKLRADQAQFARVQEHYAFSIEHMVGEAERAGVPMLVMTVPVNLRDWHPHVSKQTLGGLELAAWTTLCLRARKELSQGDPASALASLEQALRQEPEHAAAMFWKGKALAALGRHSDALVSFRAAKDADLNPFRCLSAFNETLRATAARHSKSKLLDLERLCADELGMAPGFDLFLDYVHPSRRGNLLIARAVFTTIVDQALLPASPAMREFLAGESGYTDEGDPFLQITLLSLFSTMHQYEAFLTKLDLVEKLQREGAFHLPESALKDANDLLSRCRKEFTSYLDNERKQILGESFDADYISRHRDFYREFFARLTTLKTGLPATK